MVNIFSKVNLTIYLEYIRYIEYIRLCEEKVAGLILSNFQTQKI